MTTHEPRYSDPKPRLILVLHDGTMILRKRYEAGEESRLPDVRSSLLKKYQPDDGYRVYEGALVELEMLKNWGEFFKAFPYLEDIVREAAAG